LDQLFAAFFEVFEADVLLGQELEVAAAGAAHGAEVGSAA